MKKKLNLLCTLVFIVLLCSLAESIYATAWGAIQGGKMGTHIKPEEFLHMHVINVFPNDLIHSCDSLHNALTNQKLPFWYTQAAVSINDNKTITSNIIQMTLSYVIIICAIVAIIQFIKFIRNINRSEIFSWRNVKLLRKLGIYLLIVFIANLSASILSTWQVSQVLSIPGYSYNWLHPLSESSLLLGVLAFVFAEIFAIGLKMKEEQDLTI